MKKNDAFTLAEVLITLTIIGIVAAMTMPSLLTTINNSVKDKQKTVIERKIQKGTNLLNIDYGIGPYYDSTRAFLTRLSEHLKISTICDSGEDMKNCFPEIVNTVDGQVDITKIKDGSNFGLDKEDYPDVAGVILGDGTPMILAWKKTCEVSDPDVPSNQKTGSTSDCLSGFIDLNGFKGTNRISSDINKIADIIPFNHASGLSEGGMPCLFTLASGKCLTAPPNEYKPMLRSEYCNSDGTVNSYGTSLGITKCMYNGYQDGDYWAGAVRACGGTAKLPSQNDLQQLAQNIYGQTVSAEGYYPFSQNFSNREFLAAMTNLGLKHMYDSSDSHPWFDIWSSKETNNQYAAARRYMTTMTSYDENYFARGDWNIRQVLCVSD